MKNNHFSILGLVLAAFVFTASGGLFAQNQTKSDTISISSSSQPYMAVQDFGPIAKGEKACHTIYVKNASDYPLVINSFGQSYYPRDEFTVKSIPSLPVFLLKGEIISIADVCFSPVNPTMPQVEGQLLLTGTFSGKKDSGNMYVYASAIGRQIVDTMLQKSCVTTSFDASIFGPVIMDGDVTKTVTVESNRYDTLKLDMNSSGYPDNASFSFSGITFPYYLTPKEKKTFSVTYSPRSNAAVVKYRHIGNYTLAASMRINDTIPSYYYYCDSGLNISLLGVAIPPTADSISTSLAAGSTDVLAMISDNSVTTKTFHFKNTTSGNLKVTGVAMKNGKSYAINNITPTNTLPFTLAAGESMSVNVAMTTVANGVYYDEVIITAENAIMSMSYQLQGLRKNGTQAAVKTSDQKHLLLYPNPTSGSITLDLPSTHSTHIEVLDVLGKVIAKASATKSWTWNGNAPAGMYILQATGIDDNGKAFHDEEHFVIRK